MDSESFTQTIIRTWGLIASVKGLLEIGYQILALIRKLNEIQVLRLFCKPN